MMKTPFQYSNLIKVAFILILLIIALDIAAAYSATPIERCQEQGGVWQTYPTAHCAPPDMTNEQIQQAQRYVALKQIEMREVRHAVHR